MKQPEFRSIVSANSVLESFGGTHNGESTQVPNGFNSWSSVKGTDDGLAIDGRTVGAVTLERCSVVDMDALGWWEREEAAHDLQKI